MSTAQRVLSESGSEDPNARVDKMFELILGVDPTSDERDEFVTFIQDAESAPEIGGR